MRVCRQLTRVSRQSRCWRRRLSAGTLVPACCVLLHWIEPLSVWKHQLSCPSEYRSSHFYCTKNSHRIDTLHTQTPKQGLITHTKLIMVVCFPTNSLLKIIFHHLGQLITVKCECVPFL